MIKLPKEVNRILKALEGAGEEAFAAGECVRDSLVGESPFGWDVLTSAGLDKLKELFPDGKVISEKYGILRMEYIEEIYDKDGEFEGEEGLIIDVAAYRSGTTIESQLERKDFTIDAIADSLGRIADPFGGREDILLELRAEGHPSRLWIPLTFFRK